MKRFLGFALMLAFLTTSAFAANKSQKVTLPMAVQVGSTQLAAGVYELTTTGTGSNVQVTLARNNKAVVTFPATQITEKNTPGLETYTHGNVVALESIHLDKESFTVTGAPQPVQGQ
jgi:hypothetical protein